MVAKLAAFMAMVPFSAAQSPHCPCLTVDSLPIVDDCLAPTCESPMQLNTSVCVNASYGSTVCQSWDIDTPICQGPNAPDYCLQPWCYVDATQCRRATAVSPPRYTKSAFFPSIPNLYFSYETCGGAREDWEAFEATLRSAERTLITVVPSMAYAPYHYKLDPTTGDPFDSHSEAVYQDDSNPFQGVLVEYLNALASVSYSSVAPRGFNMTWVSRPTRAAHGSSWTAAVADVGSGLADVGGSNFWITSERLAMTSFTSSLATDLMYLFVPAPTVDNSFMSQLMRPFDPFTWDVWLLTLLVILCSGTLQCVLTARLWWDEWAERVKYEEASDFQKGLLLVSRVTEGWYMSYLTMLNGAPELDENQRLATRLLNMGVGLFACILIAAYTANLAAFLGRPPMGDMVNSMQQATERGMKVCAHLQLNNSLARIYPRTHFHYRFMDTASDLQQAMSTDECDAFIMSMRDMRVGGGPEAVRCGLEFVAAPSPVLEVPIALPASPDAADALSYWMKTAADHHGISYAAVQASYEFPHRCAIHADIIDGENLQSLNLTNFTAPLLLAFFFMGLAVCTRVTRKMMDKQKVLEKVDTFAKAAKAKTAASVALVTKATRSSPDASAPASADPSPAAPSSAAPTSAAPVSALVEAQQVLLANDAPKQDALKAIEENMRTISRQLQQLHEASSSDRALRA